MWPILLISVYCICVAAASLLGGWLPSLIRLTHTRMQLMMSLVGGLMMGVALLHLIPHAASEAGSLDQAVTCTVLGLLAMYFTIRVFHVHGHEPPEHAARHEHHPDAGSQHSPPTCAPGCTTHVHGLSWLGLFIGLGLHTLIDGVALAASVAVSAHATDAGGWIGLGTFLAVLLHKPLDALSITSIMLGGGWSDRWRSIVNAVFALMCPLGALVFFYGVRTLGSAHHSVVGCALGFAAGAFLCIALADVLPEVQFHRHDRWKLSTALLLGVVLAWGIGFLEPRHAHDVPASTPASDAQHEVHEAH